MIRPYAKSKLVGARRCSFPSLNVKKPAWTNSENRTDKDVVKWWNSSKETAVPGTPGKVSEDPSPTPSLSNGKAEDNKAMSEWTKDEIRQLDALKVEMNPLESNFWKKVAARMKTKSAVECQRKWFEKVKTPKERKRKNPSNIRMEKLARKNTKKFKKQVRQFVQQMEQEHDDDELTIR